MDKGFKMLALLGQSDQLLGSGYVDTDGDLELGFEVCVCGSVDYDVQVGG